MRKREIASPDGEAEEQAANGTNPAPSDEDTEVPPAAMPEEGSHLRRLVMDLLSSFVGALETSPSRLHAPERQEVVAGLVSRAGRELIAVLGAPSLWCLEHGAHVGRMLVESEIYLHWMAQQDVAVYRQFQEYGFGKAKLYSKIFEELPEDARTAGFRESMEELRRLSRNDSGLDLRTVDTRDTFAEGKSLRAMAEEGGLLDLYRHAYSMASGVVHSEWWSIEMQAMERCLNVLHGLHLIPNLSLNHGANVDLARTWVDQFHALIQDGFRILGTPQAAMDEAFAWLNANEPEAGREASQSGSEKS